MLQVTEGRQTAVRYFAASKAREALALYWRAEALGRNVTFIPANHGVWVETWERGTTFGTEATDGTDSQTERHSR